MPGVASVILHANISDHVHINVLRLIPVFQHNRSVRRQLPRWRGRAGRRGCLSLGDDGLLAERNIAGWAAEVGDDICVGLRRIDLSMTRRRAEATTPVVVIQLSVWAT
jgi:hypothetical protein